MNTLHPRPKEEPVKEPRERDNEHPDPQEDRPNTDERINEQDENEARRQAGLKASASKTPLP